MVSELHRLGREVDTDELDRIVDAFRGSAGVVAGMVLPWDRAVDEEALDAPASDARAGTLWSAHAECRWRVEARGAVVTVLSDRPLDGVDLEAVDAQVRDEPAVAWVRRPVSRGVDVETMHPRLYLVDGAPAHRRLAVADQEG